MCSYFVFARFHCKMWFKIISIGSLRTKINIFRANILLICILLWRRTRLFRLELFVSTVCCVLITNIFIYVQLFQLDCHTFTYSRKLYVCLKTFLCFFTSVWSGAFKGETTFINYHVLLDIHSLNMTDFPYITTALNCLETDLPNLYINGGIDTIRTFSLKATIKHRG